MRNQVDNSNPFTATREPRKQIFYIPGQPFVTKADCKAGLFLPIGEKPIVNKAPNPAGSDTIRVQVIKHGDWLKAVLFPMPGGEAPKRQDWTEVIFSTEKGLLCSMLLKGESRDRFLRLLIEIEAEGEGMKNYTDYTIVGRMVDRTSKTFSSDYFAIEWSKEPIAPADFERNKQFAVAHYESLFVSRTALEYVDNNVPGITDPTQRLVAAVKFAFAFGFISKEVSEREQNLLLGLDHAEALPAAA